MNRNEIKYVNKNQCNHKNCWWYPLTGEWYFQTKETECMDPDYIVFGITYCPWCGKELSKDGKTSS